MQLSSCSGACYVCATTNSNGGGNQNHETHVDRNTCFHTCNAILQCTFLLLLYFSLTLPDLIICRKKNCIDGLLQFGETCMFMRGFFPHRVFHEGLHVRCLSPTPCFTAASLGAQQSPLPQGVHRSEASLSVGCSAGPGISSPCLGDRH